ncbi:hypothetical protein [Streptomyces sp. KAU_LT]|uniref:hypothetical protein n=1 Tax=Streptomyces sp. KAU_LT TaxID=3046669 RepID=UPI0024B7D4CB|nr:hypothetical protein [Streptomyces sp. KAU_LT]MDI9829687.1 hypothetical protein [Streptomyces sp. KAU_LT]
MSTRGAYTPSSPRVERATAVTDGAGNVTFTWPAGAFSAPPVVTVSLQGAVGFRSHTVTANSAGSTTVNVLGAPVVSLLGIQILAASVPASGVTVHAHAVGS